MSAVPTGVATFAAAEGAQLGVISGALVSIAAGVIALDTLITNLQNSPGQLSASDQASLDAIQAQSAALVTQVTAISTAAPGSVVPVTPTPASTGAAPAAAAKHPL